MKASIVGSILGNVLLVLGAAMFFGGLGRERQFFNRTAANVQSLMLFLAVAAMGMPAIYQLVDSNGLPAPGSQIVDYGGDVETLSLLVAVVLLLTYVAGLLFSLRTHRDLFNPIAAEAEPLPVDGPLPAPSAAAAPAAAVAGSAPEAPAAPAAPAQHGEHGEPWSVRKAVVALAIAGVAVGVMSEILVGSIGETAEKAGLSEFFIGVIVVAIVGNAAEHWVAVLVARKNQMDLAVNIAIGSSAQVALFVMPVLVMASFVLGPHPMAFVLNGFELGAIFLAALIANQVTSEGESTWFEGLQLLAVYAVFAIAFFFA